MTALPSEANELRTLDAMVENGWNAKRCQDEGHADRPTREAFDEVCRSVELQRRALVKACLITEGPDEVPFERLIEHVREVMLVDVRRAARADENDWTMRHQLAEALGHRGVTDASVTLDDLLGQVCELAKCPHGPAHLPWNEDGYCSRCGAFEGDQEAPQRDGSAS